ncbi:MAG TPA: V-type ATP synthase subunit F [Planctomycetota bacterium]|nr:V-type ATP synthase subunit F [Planctomycetota bacterium]HRR78927.1 V-type ATP synthase subunit F [Planctomycetota bacterium]HRT92795.1 V-type ATP synthase subunit F [Planctomycetota bacterium]
MHYYVIGDEDTVLGFRYAGVPGDIVKSAEAAHDALERVLRRRDVVILIMTDRVADWIRPEVNRVHFDFELPLVVEVPGPAGPSPERKDLLTLIREAVGIKV